MSSLEELLREWPRIIILYPIYNTISKLLEEKFPLVKTVRENPNKYTENYISERRTQGYNKTAPDYQLVELFTNYKNAHVEVMTLLIREKPTNWCIDKKRYIGHIFAEMSDASFKWLDSSVIKLSQNFYSE